MTVLQAAAIITLWRSCRFDTLDIAGALQIREPDVLKLLHEIRNRERGPILRVVHP